MVVHARGETQAVGHLIFIGRAGAVFHEVVAVVHERVQARDHQGLVAPGARAAPQAQARVVPRGREDGVLPFRPVDREEIQGLVGVVESADRHHEVPQADIQLRGETLLDPELLELDLAALLDLGLPLARLGELLLHGGARAGVLELDLGLHGPALAEVVAEVDHRVRDVETPVGRVVAVVVGMGIAIDVVTEEIAGQGDLAVSAYGQPSGGLRPHLGSQGNRRRHCQNCCDYAPFHTLLLNREQNYAIGPARTIPYFGEISRRPGILIYDGCGDTGK